METFIEQHSAINKDMMIMVRQLQPSAHGLPIEIYAFSSDKRWANYEYIIADIFDHMIASVNDFDLGDFGNTGVYIFKITTNEYKRFQHQIHSFGPCFRCD